MKYSKFRRDLIWQVREYRVLALAGRLSCLERRPDTAGLQVQSQARAQPESTSDA